MKLLVNLVSSGPYYGGPALHLMIVDQELVEFLELAHETAQKSAAVAGDKFFRLELDLDSQINEFWVDDPYDHFNKELTTDDDGHLIESDFVDGYLILEGEEAQSRYEEIGHELLIYTGADYTRAVVDVDGDVFFVVQESYGTEEYCVEFPLNYGHFK